MPSDAFSFKRLSKHDALGSPVAWVNQKHCVCFTTGFVRRRHRTASVSHTVRIKAPQRAAVGPPAVAKVVSSSIQRPASIHRSVYNTLLHTNKLHISNRDDPNRFCRVARSIAACVGVKNTHILVYKSTSVPLSQTTSQKPRAGCGSPSTHGATLSAAAYTHMEGSVRPAADGPAYPWSRDAITK